MYLLSIFFKNAQKNGTGEFILGNGNGVIPKWTALTGSAHTRELLHLMASALGGPSFLPHLQFRLSQLRRNLSDDFQLEIIVARHSWDSMSNLPVQIGSGIRIDHVGCVTQLTNTDRQFLPSNIPIRRFGYGTGNTPYFLLGYGPELHAHEETDDFSFADPFFRVARFHSLFNRNALITDPLAFLNKLHYRATRASRYPAIQTMLCLAKLFSQYLDIDTRRWMKKTCEFGQELSRLYSWQRKMLLPILDVTRHLMDAFPRSGKPLEMPGLLLFDRPDRFCTERSFARWITLVDFLFPNLQIAARFSEKSRALMPQAALSKQLYLPTVTKQPHTRHVTHVPSKAVLLLDVDSRLPNLALMKISRHFKQQGRKVMLARRDSFLKDAEEVYASCVFFSPASQARIKQLQRYYGKSLILGGSGVDVSKRLPHEIERLPADYTLYPDLKDRAIGFPTRGCSFDCPFCIVPGKEGKVRQVNDLESLLRHSYKKLILLDDNILSHPNATNFLEEMTRGNLQVNFTQTLDIRSLDKEKAQILKRIHCSNSNFTRRIYHFSLNDARNLNQLRRKYELLDFTSRDNVEFICMYGYNTTLAEDVERFSFLRSLPGAYVFVQEYQPILGGPKPDLVGFFDDNTDELIDTLVKICFPQNMKSMEKYYRWLSKRYVLAFGALHKGLVDTIFRYNYRDRKGMYISTLAGTKKR